MSRSTTSTRKQKTFPALDIPIPNLPIQESDSASDSGSEFESDAPEAVTLAGGRAAAAARDGAVKAHEREAKERRKEKNKARDEFIKSTRPKQDKAEEQAGEEDGEDEGEGGPSDPALEARMARAMQDAQTEEESSDEEAGEPEPTRTLTTRLPEAIFAAAAAATQSAELKRVRTKTKKGDPKAKRRRMREATDPVIDGRTIRVTTPLDAPPPISSSKRKANSATKGGTSFRRKWKKLDALRSQVRSRSGPARNFVTSAQ